MLFRKDKGGGTGKGAPVRRGDGPAISLAKVQQEAPGLVEFARVAAVSLEGKGLTGFRSAVYLVLDHSTSMKSLYQSGAMQKLAEQVLGLAVNLDDDGVVPVVLFSQSAQEPVEVGLDNYAGRIQGLSADAPWGSTDYVAAIDKVVEHYLASGATDPALVVFQSDGDPKDRDATERKISEVAHLPMFWAFVGFGDDTSFLRKLNTFRERVVDNASFFPAPVPSAVTDSALYDGITHEVPLWIASATAAGILSPGR